MHYRMVVMLIAGFAAMAQEDMLTMEILTNVPDSVPAVAEVRAVTHGPKHHFFGYYGMSPWDATERYLVCLETEFGDRSVQAEDIATLILNDLETGEAKPLTTTSAWNFQQGSLIHWLATAPDRQIIYNDRIDGQPKAVILDVFTGEKRILPRPIAAASHDGKTAASINYARLHTTRPGYGYAGVEDPFADDRHPKPDGLYVMDVTTGEHKLIVSMDQIFHFEPVPAEYVDSKMWFNHVLFSRDDKRLFFLARFQPKIPGPLVTAAFTVNTDGSELRCVLPYSWGASHYDWLDGKHMVVSSKYRAEKAWLHVFFEDGSPLESYRTLAPEVLSADGHCHFSQDGQWMVSDSYPRGKGRMRSFYIMTMATSAAGEIARFHEPKIYNSDWRCDLHPRWNRDATKICIDSAHNGTRQVYIVVLKPPKTK